MVLLVRVNMAAALRLAGQVERAAALIDPLLADVPPTAENVSMHSERVCLDAVRGCCADALGRLPLVLDFTDGLISNRLEEARFLGEALLWCGRPGDAFDLLLEVLHRALATDAAMACGAPLVVAARAAADLAEGQGDDVRAARAEQLRGLRSGALREPIAGRPGNPAGTVEVAAWAAGAGQAHADRHGRALDACCPRLGQPRAAARRGVLPLARCAGRAGSGPRDRRRAVAPPGRGRSPRERATDGRHRRDRGAHGDRGLALTRSPRPHSPCTAASRLTRGHPARLHNPDRKEESGKEGPGSVPAPREVGHDVHHHPLRREARPLRKAARRRAVHDRGPAGTDHGRPAVLLRLPEPSRGVPRRQRPHPRRESYGRGRAARGADYVVVEPYAIDSGKRAMRRLLGLETPPTAVFAYSDELAIGRCAPCRRRASPCPAGLPGRGRRPPHRAAVRHHQRRPGRRHPGPAGRPAGARPARPLRARPAGDRRGVPPRGAHDDGSSPGEGPVATTRRQRAAAPAPH